MKIRILAAGKEKDFAGYQLVSEYISRICHYYPAEISYISGVDEKDENEKLEKALDKLPDGSHIIVLDEAGKKMSSVDFSKYIDSVVMQSVKQIVYVIGGAYGIPASIRHKARYVVSLSDMTFTHTMVRLIIAEQIYRACTIQRGQKYHHG